MLFVKVARYDDGGRDRVQNGEDADANHQPLELVRLSPPLLLDDVANPEQRDETREQERHSDDEIHEERGEDETSQVFQVLVAHVADSCDGVAVHGGHGQNCDALHAGDEPGREVEVLRVAGDRLLPPLQPRRQEPREGQNDPPDRRRHAEEVDEQEDDGADGGPRRLVADHVAVAGDVLVSHDEADDVADADHEVAGAEKDDGPLRVLESLHVDEEGAHRHGGGNAAQNGPQTDPECRERPLVVAEVRAVAVDGAVEDPSRRYPVVLPARLGGDGHQRMETPAHAVFLRRAQRTAGDGPNPVLPFQRFDPGYHRMFNPVSPRLRDHPRRSSLSWP